MPYNVSTRDSISPLRQVRTHIQLLSYLVDVQGWPEVLLESLEDEDLSSVTYDFTPEELGIPEIQVPKLRRLQQMQPLTANQPWGVFFLQFTGSKLPHTQVRRMLRALVHKRRSSAGGSNRTWHLNDLLFAVITGATELVELHLVAFDGTSPADAQFKSLSWCPAHSPDRHLKRLDEELLPNLAWPIHEHDTETWRQGWRQAFKLRPGQQIKDAKRLAERMASTARQLRAQINDALDAEAGSGPFSDLMHEIRTQLVSDVDDDEFADMCAQTMVYGMLSSRVTNPEDFGSSPIYSTVPLANPFLEAFFEKVQDQVESHNLTGNDLPQLVADLRETNVEAMLDQVDSTIRGGDPIVHFYENFLEEYDPKTRLKAGAFYTPRPAVEFIVRAVDEVMKSHFNLEMGVADSATWQQVAERNGFEVPKGVDPAKPFVSMIDPATGTGTFLVEWLQSARRSYTGNNWPTHLRDHVLRSMHAFEFMLAPYAIAHLKVALELHEHGVGDHAKQIFLTNTLNHPDGEAQFTTMLDPVAHEGERAAKLKQSERFTVVVGNPPYDREQKEVGDTSKRKGGVVRYGVKGLLPLIDAIAEPMKQADQGHHLKNVYNDYVYFWRWALWQATELPPGPGVVAFITASSYLDGVSMGGLRHLLRDRFDEIWIVDLGGEGRGALKEDNIFDIQTPVAIGIGIRTRTEHAEDCIVRYLRVAGTRSEKLQRLRDLSLALITEEVSGLGLDNFTPLSDSTYFDWPELTDLLPWHYSGCQAKRTWPIAETETVLRERWKNLLAGASAEQRALLRETGSRKLDKSFDSLLGNGDKLLGISALRAHDPPEAIERYAYRSFDRQYIVADMRVVDAPKRSLWDVRGPQQVYLTTLTSTKFGQGPVLTATPYVPDLHHFRGSYGAKNVMPLYRDGAATTPNMTLGLVSALSHGLRSDVAAEDVLAYMYALGATSAFSNKFGERLAEAAGPVRVPITRDPELFAEAVALGRDLLWWHTWGERVPPPPPRRQGLPAGNAKEVRPVGEMPERFGYDAATQTLSVGDGAFGPVAPEVWEFEVSGLKVLKSWLGYRMRTRNGRKSSPLDDIRPTRWTQTDELLLVLSIIEHTVEVTPQAADLLDRIVAGPLFLASDLPTPTPAERKPPKKSGTIV